MIDICNKSIEITGVNGITANETDMGINKKYIVMSSVDFILYYLSKLRLCIGFVADEHSENVIRKENDPTCYKMMVTCESDIANTNTRVISKRCKLFVSTNESNIQSTCCIECSSVKKILHKRRAEYKNWKKKTKNCLLAREEITKKLKLIEKEKANALRKAAYWKNKFYAEAIQVYAEDDDYRKMFVDVDQSMVPDGLKLLFEQQQKALGVRDPSGRRWHPQ